MKMAYDYRQDAFYQKETINVTWIMIWNGSTETHWWNPDEYWGTRAYVDGKYQSIDWNNPQHLEEYFHQMRLAGIDVIASDLTNGLGWIPQTQQIQRLCLQYGMKLCVAINHHGTKISPRKSGRPAPTRRASWAPPICTRTASR